MQVMKNLRQTSVHYAALFVCAALPWCDSAAAAQEAQGSRASQETQTVLPVGWQPPTPVGLLSEPALIKKLANASDGSLGTAGRDGVYANLGNMITGAGWISGGPGFRHHIFGNAAVVDASAAVSWNLYKVAQARIDVPAAANDRLSFGAQAMYQDVVQVNYFGPGPDSRQADRSAYRLHDTDVVGYGTLRATGWLSMTGSLGRSSAPAISTATGRNVSVPNTKDVFTEATAPGIGGGSSFIHGDISLVADWRDYAGHPTRGGVYRATASAYSDRDGGVYSFRRYELDAAQFIPLFTPKWVVAVRAWEVVSEASRGAVIPFYLMPSLGGQNTLRGYDDYRFHDNNLQLVSVESRWAFFAHLDAVVFADAGKVAGRAGDLDFTHLKTTYGAGFRVHNATSTLARLDVGHSAEGWRLLFKLSDPFKRSTPAFGRTSIVPFVP
jgi:hypothetical protein